MEDREPQGEQVVRLRARDDGGEIKAGNVLLAPCVWISVAVVV